MWVASVVVLMVVPVRVETAAGLREVRFGWPFEWLSQDLGYFAGDALPAIYYATEAARTTDVVAVAWLACVALFALLAVGIVGTWRRLRPAPSEPSATRVGVRV